MIHRSHGYSDVKQNPEKVPKSFFKRPGWGIGNFRLFGCSRIHKSFFLKAESPELNRIVK
jgi:hypothetical protein